MAFWAPGFWAPGFWAPNFWSGLGAEEEPPTPEPEVPGERAIFGGSLGNSVVNRLGSNRRLKVEDRLRKILEAIAEGRDPNEIAEDDEVVDAPALEQAELEPVAPTVAGPDPRQLLMQKLMQSEQQRMRMQQIEQDDEAILQMVLMQ